eukprot:TRINITY_DN4104_c4_g1_i1.p1 TRINITY_DN4104_c4_g1~~TRINITY_DN4104_c4_g1_i1.p1  ORF type:complete len:167 (+),score=27.66 TRINITY_DN4104_c4_g1_i1:89-589(+)
MNTNTGSPMQYLEYYVLDDKNLVTCTQLAAVYKISLEEARGLAWQFHQANKAVTTLYASVVVPGTGTTPFRIEIKPTMFTSENPSTLYAVGNTACVSTPSLPGDHYPPQSVPSVTLPPSFIPALLSKKRKRRPDIALGDPGLGKKQHPEEAEVMELSDSEDIIVID